ncbi:hypothetical protein [Moorena producens]|nr:hypothetical protein [Moorena producens]
MMIEERCSFGTGGFPQDRAASLSYPPPPTPHPLHPTPHVFVKNLPL